MTGPRPGDRAPGRRPSRALAAAAAAGAVAALAALAALAACGARQPPAPPAQDGPGTAATPNPTSTQVAGSMNIADARIPAPPDGASTAQAEMTLGGAIGPDTLRAASSPAARAVVFTSDGHAFRQIPIPLADGSSISTGPPTPTGSC